MGRILDAGKRFFTDDEWPHEEISGSTILRTGFKGQNGQFTCYFQERDEHQQMVFYAVLPTQVPEDKRAEVAEYITRANYAMVIGNFEMDYRDGEIRFKTAADVEGTEFPTMFVKNMVYAAVFMMDRYLPGLMMVIYGGMEPAEAVAQVEGDDS